MTKTEIKTRLAFAKAALGKLQAAYLALIDGGVKMYTIDDRQLTKLDLPVLSDEITKQEREISQLESALSGHGTRRVFSAVPKDW